MVQFDTARTDLSNNGVMRLGKEHLAWRIRITEVSTQKFWKSFHTQEDTGAWSVYHVDCLQMFPSHQLGCLEKEQRHSNKVKDQAVKAIGKYLTRVKMVVMLITVYTYRVRGSDKAVPMCKRLFEPTDVLDMCGYVKVMDDDELDETKICMSAAKTVLSSFHHINIHYTYTLSHTGKENGDANVVIDMEVDSDDEADDLEEGNMEEDENEPRFNSISEFFIKIIHVINTLTLTMHYSVIIWS
jgi:hypothetical protein